MLILFVCEINYFGMQLYVNNLKIKRVDLALVYLKNSLKEFIVRSVSIGKSAIGHALGNFTML